MIRVRQSQSVLFRPMHFQKLLSRGRIHCISLLFWISFIMIGTFLIGYSTSLYQKQFQYCSPSEDMCYRQLKINQIREVSILVKLQNFWQNNRMFLNYYSQLQLQGNLNNNFHCQNYDTYESLEVKQNVAGQRVPQSTNAFPCGKAMRSIFNDSLHLIASDGSALQLNSMDLVSDYSRQNKFKNLDNYQMRQWIDMESPEFINHFTIPYTSTKYHLMGKLQLKPDTYQLIIRNNYLKDQNNQITKTILITETNSLGIRDNILGFTMFIWGIILLCFHLLYCLKGKR